MPQPFDELLSAAGSNGWGGCAERPPQPFPDHIFPRLRRRDLGGDPNEDLSHLLNAGRVVEKFVSRLDQSGELRGQVGPDVLSDDQLNVLGIPLTAGDHSAGGGMVTEMTLLL